MHFFYLLILLFFFKSSVAQIDTIGSQPWARYFNWIYDNDYFTHTDQYYTLGGRAEYIAPAFYKLPLAKLLIARDHGINYYGLSLSGGGYTPTDIVAENILTGDRPFAGYVYAGCFLISNNPEKRNRLTTEVDVGIIGPAALGEPTQTIIHRELSHTKVPRGWNNQVSNDIIWNYFIAYKKGIWSFRDHADIIAGAECNAGTFLDNASLSGQLRFGLFNSYFESLGMSNKGERKKFHHNKFQWYGYFRLKGTFVGYNASLQGGLFNKNSPYVLKSGEIERLLTSTSVGVVFCFGKFMLEYAGARISPEFEKRITSPLGTLKYRVYV